MIRSILHALVYIHAKGICHRDLKLENIMLERKSPDSDLKLIDFGLSLKVYSYFCVLFRISYLILVLLL